MEISRNEQAETELLEVIWKDMQDDTRTGISVTGLIYCLTKTYYENYYTVTKQAPNRRVLMLFATGLALERTFLGNMQVAVAGEYEGIAYHLDHLGNDERFVEFKSTRISLKNAPDRYNLTWYRQIMSYFKAKGLTKGQIIVLHLMGAYQPPFPDLAVWDLEFSQEEIDENWLWMTNRKDVYELAVVTGEAPAPFKYNEDWECEDCSWKMICDERFRNGS